jgi:hypothetical protein
MEVLRAGQFNLSQLPDRSVAKPGEFIEGQKPFCVLDQQPETVDRDIRDFNGSSALSTLGGFHLRVPPRDDVLYLAAEY